MKAQRVLLIATAFAVACWSQPAVSSAVGDREMIQSPGQRAARPSCPAGARYHVKANGDEVELRKRATAPEYDELAIIEWRADLNRDGFPDFGASLMGTGGSKGESMWIVFVNCGANEVVAAWGPEYVVAIEAPTSALKARRGAWLDLVRVTRVEQADRQQRDRIEKHTLRFSQSQYRVAP